jgi:hypothetical protein
MYDFHGVELYTIYDSHDVYLHVLQTIYMYKFSRCHAIIFHGFFLSVDRFSAKFIRFLPIRTFEVQTITKTSSL